MRMKHAMTSIVDQERIVMFRRSTQEVRTRLSSMITAMEETMNNKIDEVFMMMRRDYLTVLGGPDLPKGEIMPKWGRLMRTEVMNIIDSSERTFKRIAGIDDGHEEELNVGGLRKISGDEAGKDEPGKETYEEDDEPLFRAVTSASDDGRYSDHPYQAGTDDANMQEPDNQQDSAHANMPDGREHTTIQNLTEQGASGFVIDNTNGAEAAKDQMPTPQEEASKDAENPSTTRNKTADNNHKDHEPIAKYLNNKSENNREGADKSASPESVDYYDSAEDSEAHESTLSAAGNEDMGWNMSSSSGHEDPDASDHIASSPANESADKREDGLSPARGHERSGAGDLDVVEEKMDEGE